MAKNTPCTKLDSEQESLQPLGAISCHDNFSKLQKRYVTGMSQGWSRDANEVNTILGTLEKLNSYCSSLSSLAFGSWLIWNAK